MVHTDSGCSSDSSGFLIVITTSIVGNYLCICTFLLIGFKDDHPTRQCAKMENLKIFYIWCCLKDGRIWNTLAIIYVLFLSLIRESITSESNPSILKLMSVLNMYHIFKQFSIDKFKLLSVFFGSIAGNRSFNMWNNGFINTEENF